MLRELFNRARDILRTEGVVPMLRKGLGRYIYRNATFYVYEHTIKERNEADFLPKVQNFTIKIVHNNQQADELESEGYCFRSHFIGARNGLERGAIAFCIFIDREFAHIGWVATNEEAKRTFDYLPYLVDFTKGEACTGGTETVPKFGGNGLMAYGYYKRFEFLKQMGITTSRNATETSNIMAQRVHAKFCPRICAQAKYLKLLWWEKWEERPPGERPHAS